MLPYPILAHLKFQMLIHHKFLSFFDRLGICLAPMDIILAQLKTYQLSATIKEFKQILLYHVRLILCKEIKVLPGCLVFTVILPFDQKFNLVVFGVNSMIQDTLNHKLFLNLLLSLLSLLFFYRFDHIVIVISVFRFDLTFSFSHF